MFLLVLAHPGSPGQRAVKRLLLLFRSLLAKTVQFSTCSSTIVIVKVVNSTFKSTVKTNPVSPLVLEKDDLSAVIGYCW